MKAIEVDARRYAWSRGNVLWIMGLPISTFMEDVNGAAEADQDGLARHVGRAIGEACAVMIAVSGFAARPIPPPSVRGAWALEIIAGHELRGDCWTLISGRVGSAGETARRCEELVARVREIVGDVPDPLTPEGYFPALALARQWLELLDAVGEPGFLPREWTGA